MREARASRLDLRPLGEEALKALVARYALPAEEVGRLVAYLRARSDGNPLFAGELLRALEETGTLRQGPGGWTLDDPGNAGVPPLLRQVLDARLDRLGEGAREALEAAAVVGQQVPLAMWRAVAGDDEDALLATVERATAARLLAELPDARGVRFAHALVREALYEAIPILRRRALHRRAAEALLAGPDPDPDAVAGHLQRAGDARAAAWLVAAGERARRGHAWATAAERFAAALSAPGDEATTRGGGWLLLRIGLLRRYADREEALARLEAAETAGRRADDARLAARAQFARGLVRCHQNDIAAGLPAMGAALATLERLPDDDDQARARLRAQGLTDDLDSFRATYALWLAVVGRYAEAVPRAEAVAAHLPSTPAAAAIDGAFAPDALRALGIAYAGLGRAADARGMFRRAREACRASDDATQEGMTAWQELRAVALPYQADDPAVRRALAAEGRSALARARREGMGTASPRVVELPVLWVEGRWAELLAACGELRRPSAHTWEVVASARAAGPLARHLGDAALALAAVREALPPGMAPTPDTARHLEDLPVLRLAAEVALDAGDLAGARPWLEAHDRWLARSGAVPGRAEGWLAWAAYHRAAGDLASAREHAEAALAHATDPRQPLALLAAHRTLGELDAAVGHHADATAHLAAALALADACAAPHKRALTLLALAELHASTGARGPAGAALAEARAILAPLGARPALARADALAARLAAPARPLGLTPREAEILALLAEGLTDAQIAARLCVSRHTVNGHTKALYAKLGVASRARAARLARDHGLA